MTAGEIPDPHAIEIACRIWRQDRLLYEGSVSTGQMKRRCDELARWLCRDNLIPAGTVLCTGTGILVPDEHSLQDGDMVEVTASAFGTLRIPVRQLEATTHLRR